MKKILLILLLSSMVTGILSAQTVEVAGEVDFEFSKGGDDSKFISNEIVNEYKHPHVSINQFNLFVSSQLSDSWFFSTRFQMDTWGTGKLNQPRITLASLTWQPEKSSISATLGRFLSPFGLYSKRQLISQNLFGSAPLMYGYFVNISDKWGFWPAAGNSGDYFANSDVGITTLYFGAYTTGASFNWIVAKNRVNLEVAYTNASLASPESYTNLANAAVIARLGVQPAIWWQQGFSVNYGSFMQSSSDNTPYRIANPLEQYKQLILGTDFVFAYSFFELSGEAAYSKWNVPKWTSKNGFFFSANSSTRFQEYKLENFMGYTDLKIELPFIAVGTYLAFRAERIAFQPFNDPLTNIRSSWDSGVTRLSAGFGYKLSRSVIAKVVYSDQKIDGAKTDLKDFAIRSFLVVTF